MAKLLFTADLHIKLSQANIKVDWAQARFRMFIRQLQEMQQLADIAILGGDIFDKVPTGIAGVQEMELYYELVDSMTIPTLVYSGNHEATTKSNTFLTSLKNSTTKINSKVEIIDDFWTDASLDLDIIPYNRLYYKYPTYLNNRILCTHVRGEIPPHVKPEIDLSRLARWPLVLAGDLHSHSNSQQNILYPGSPYTVSFHRKPVETGALIVDTKSLEHEWIAFNLPQLLKKTVAPTDLMPTDDFHHVVYEVEGNMAELAEVSGDNVKKKLTKRASEAALILGADMSLNEELQEYLQYVLKLDTAKVADILLTYNDVNPEAIVK